MAAGFLVVAVILGSSAAADDRQVPLFCESCLIGGRFQQVMLWYDAPSDKTESSTIRLISVP